MPPLISIENLSFTYPDLAANARKTLHDINLTIEQGEYIAILGANGSGKSTLARMINALLLPDSGTVRIDGRDTSKLANLPEIRKTIGMVFQFPEEQIFSSTIEEDVAFGLENFAIPYKEMHDIVREELEQFDLWDIRERPSYLLSGGQTQRLALAGVLAIRPKCVIFDEATAMLDPVGRQVTLDEMKILRQKGNTILHITHSMEEAILADRIIVLLDGQVVYDGESAKLFNGDYDLSKWRLEFPPTYQLVSQLRALGLSIPPGVRTLIVLAEYLARDYSPRPVLPKSEDFHPELLVENEIEVCQLRHIYLEGTPYQSRAILNAEMNVEKSTCMGLIGVTGSGKSTLLQHLNGILRPQFGSIRVGKFDLTDKSLQLSDLVKYAGLVMQNPEAQFFEEYVGDEIAYGPRMIGISEPLKDRVRWVMELVGLDFENMKDRRTTSLSGGEKRKVALASILALKPKVLLLDEPTAGLDPTSRQEVLNLFERLIHDGMTMVISSHNMEDVTRLSSNITWMEKGTSIMSAPCAEVMREIGKDSSHHMIPSICARLAILLEAKGFRFSSVPLTAEDLFKALTSGRKL